MEGGKPHKKNEAPAADKIDEAGRVPGPFDVRTVKSLVSLMTQHDLSEIELRDGNQRLRLRRGAYQPVTPVSLPAAAPMVSVAATPSATADAPAAAASVPTKQL